MKRSKQIKKAWRGLPISLKAWARKQVARDGAVAEKCAEWLASKGAALSQVEG